jgi:hypothetical protein
MNVHRWARAACVSAAGAAALGVASLGLAPGVAQAQSDYSGAMYQITYSLNCDNAQCASMFGLGGAWGWIQLSATGGNAQETVCDHPGPGSGAFHLALDLAPWSTFPSSSPALPFVDPSGEYLSISPNPFGLPPFPATYGHYSSNAFGSMAQATVAP